MDKIYQRHIGAQYAEGIPQRMEKERREYYEIIFPYLMISTVMCIVFVLFYKFGWNNMISRIQFIMLIGGILILVGIVREMTKDVPDESKILEFIIVGGVILRIGYMLYTPVNVRGHDLRDISVNGYGHAAYILKILKNGSLPETNYIQFYHPPLFHAVAACVCRTLNLFMKFETDAQILEMGKLVSCSASCWSLLLCKRISDELELMKKEQMIALSLVSFYPDLILIGARLNNDSLMIFFQLLIVLYTIRWFKEESYKNIIILAIAFGLGLMTKASIATMALFTGAFFVIKLYESLKAKTFVAIFLKYGTFIFISVPIGMWFYIRNLIRFNQPFGYVLDIGKESPIYKGDVSLIERFFWRFPFKLFDSIYANPWKEHNIPLYLVRNSMFGEFSYSIPEIYPKIIILCNLLLIIISLVAFVWVIKSKSRPLMCYSMLFLWGITIISFIGFNYAYPYGCTMDFRYITITEFIGSMFISRMCYGTSRYIRYFIVGVVVVFSLCSYYFFVQIMR